MDVAKNHKDYKKIIINRYLENGTVGFLDHEFLELLLTFSIPRRDVRRLAGGLIKKYGSFKKIQDASIPDLLSFPNMDINSAVLIKMIKDSAAYYLKQHIEKKNVIKCGLDLINYCRLSMEGLRDEIIKVAFLNIQNEIINIETIHKGTVDQSAVYPRKIIERALHHNAVAIILIHNHPGGNTKPSPADIRMTNIIVEVASAMDIEVCDHIIIGNSSYFSFKDAGLFFRNSKLAGVTIQEEPNG